MTAAPPDTVVAGDLSRQFAAFAAALEYQVLPAAAVTGAKKTLLDSIGVTLAASGAEPAVRPVVDLVRESGGRCGIDRPRRRIQGAGDRSRVRQWRDGAFA